VLNVAETLGLPKRGLPAISTQTSIDIVYEQSVAQTLSQSEPTKSITLFDPTRAKSYVFSEDELSAIPGSVNTSDYLGKTYFPLLPPHLSERFYFDATLGDLGGLVLVGEFVDEALGEDYYLLNVLSEEDTASLKALAGSSDDDKDAWDYAIDNLSTQMEVFLEDPNRAGTYLATATEDYKGDALAEIQFGDEAVDSYAISAVNGGTGYVTLIMGNGRAFTPEAEPVALQIFKVDAPLTRGELKVLTSANPLDEKVTLSHSPDFAANPSDYEFAWITGQPVGGLPPALFNYSAADVLLSNSSNTWAFQANPIADFADAYAYGYSDAAWQSLGSLENRDLVINDEGDTVDNGVVYPDAQLRETFNWAGDELVSLYLSLDLAANDGAKVYVNESLVASINAPDQTDSASTTLPGLITNAVEGASFEISPSLIQANNTIVVDLYTQNDVGAETHVELSLTGLTTGYDYSGWQAVTAGAKDDDQNGEDGKIRHIIEGASIFTLTDNYFSLRYRAKAGTPSALATGGSSSTPGAWSTWTQPQLAEGWIKRALAGINPFNQRMTDLLNNTINTDVSILTQAGQRWEGDISLNLANIDDFGLIEIYETILRRGMGLSIDGAPPLNVPAANDALLLASGYLNDLYSILGDEAFADAADPTIAYSTAGEDQQFGQFDTGLSTS